MGRTPAEQLQRQAMAPHERFCLEAGRRTTWSRRKSIVFPAERQKAQEELHHGVWDISKYLTDFSIMKKPPSLFFFVFPSHHRPVTLPIRPPWLARVIVWALRVQSGLSVRWHHVMKLAVVAKQVSIKECEPRPRARRSWITSFTDLWQTVGYIVAPFFDPSFSQVVPPRIKTLFVKERPGWECSAKQRTIMDTKTQSVRIKGSVTFSYSLALLSFWDDRRTIY